MRVNPNIQPDLVLSLQRAEADEARLLRQLASGSRIQRPSDDPAGNATVVQLKSSDAKTAQYLGNIQMVRAQVQAADSNLSSATTALQRAISLAVSGGNGTMNDSDRQAVAMEIDGISDQLLEIANATFQGTYLFSGSASTTKPFQSTAAGVHYSGSDQETEVAIGEGYSVRTSIPGTAIFGDDGSGVFASLQRLSVAVRAGSGVDSALEQVRAAYDHLSSSRVIYGNTLNQVTSTELVQKERQLQIAQQQTDVAGADLADIATRLSTAMTSRNALLSVMARGDLSLFDFLK